MERACCFLRAVVGLNEDIKYVLTLFLLRSTRIRCALILHQMVSPFPSLAGNVSGC